MALVAWMVELLKFPAAQLAVSGQMAKPCAVLQILVPPRGMAHRQFCESVRFPSQLGFSDPFFASTVSKVLLGIGIASN